MELHGGFVGTKNKKAPLSKQAFISGGKKVINWTWLKLHDDCHWDPFYAGLKEYLRQNLQIIEIDGCSYYSCGAVYHHSSIPDWQPFKNFEEYCHLKGYDDFEVKLLIEEKLGKKIICECELVNDEEADRRVRLQRSFGIDCDELGQDDM